MAAVPARFGALLGAGGILGWLALYLVAALTTPGYTISGNRLSDLGNPAEPAAWAFDTACILGGILLLLYALALGAEMSRRRRLAGRGILGTAAGFLVLVGVFPEGSLYDLHFLMSAGFFVFLVIGASHYAVAMYRTPAYGTVSGVLSSVVSGLALTFVVAVGIETVAATEIAGGMLSNLLEHATVFAALVWAAWNARRLYALGGPRAA